MSRAMQVFNQNNGEVTKSYYADMNQLGLRGQLAVALFRAQKRSTAAKNYRRGGHRRDAYEVKNWSLSEICRILGEIDGITPAEVGPLHLWGWARDEKTPGFEWVLYVDIPQGQVSFHSADRLDGPDYPNEWDGVKGESTNRILAFCDQVEARKGTAK